MFPRRLVALACMILLGSGSLSAFIITVHRDVTRKGLADLESGSPTVLQGRRFTPQAIQEIIDADMSMDTLDCSNDQRSDKNPAVPCGIPTDLDSQSTIIGEIYSGIKYAAATYPSDHFDDERLIDGNNRLMRYRNAAVAHIKDGNYIGARKQVGLALHTIQDFYAHSNWVDLGLPCCLNRLGFSDAFDNYRLAGPTEKTCEDPSTLLTDLPQNNVRVGYTLTTGYFPNSNPEIMKNHKCAHGEVTDYRGINKDSDWMYGDGKGTVRYERFNTAMDIAASHTTTFVKDILTEGCGNNRDCVWGFLGYPRTTSNTSNSAPGSRLRDCNQHLYDSAQFVSLVQTLGERLTQWAKSDPEIQRLVQQTTGQELTPKIYSAGFLERVSDCIEPVVHVLTGNQVPKNSSSRATAGASGLTVVIKAMPKPHCEALNTSSQARFAPGMFAIRFEPPGPVTNWRLGECAGNPLLSVLTLGKSLPQPNTAYLFFPLN